MLNGPEVSIEDRRMPDRCRSVWNFRVVVAVCGLRDWVRGVGPVSVRATESFRRVVEPPVKIRG